MIIDKSHSKQELVEIINEMDLDIKHSHQDCKRSIQDKIILLLKDKKIIIKENYYEIKTRDHLISFLINPNKKKSLSIKEKGTLMMICKGIIQYCKSDFDIEATDYNSLKDLVDDMDYIKQFGDIPSVRRCCRLLKDDPKMKNEFIPLISPQVQKELTEKNKKKKIISAKLIVRYATKENPIWVKFD
tara:strand:+ start:1903 stop:2463 length:561 start_codon:yes stop_codon:yes gene_type:complete